MIYYELKLFKVDGNEEVYNFYSDVFEAYDFFRFCCSTKAVKRWTITQHKTNLIQEGKK